MIKLKVKNTLNGGTADRKKNIREQHSSPPNLTIETHNIWISDRNAKNGLI